MPLTYFDAFTQFGPRPRSHGSQPWTLDHLIAELQHCSISGALVACTMQTQYDAMHENRRLSKTLEPYDWLFPIWNVHPHWTHEMPAPDDLVKMLGDHDVRAVTIYPQTNQWFLGSATSRPLFDALQKSRTLTIIDYRDVDLSQQLDIEGLLGDFPDLPILLRGVAWSQQRKVVPWLIAHRNAHIAFDYFQICNGIEYLSAYGLEDQLIYCSNAPQMSAGAHRLYVDYADVSDAVKRKVAGENLSRLLKGLKPPRDYVNSDEDSLMTEARHGQPLSTLVLDMHAHIVHAGVNGLGAGTVTVHGDPAGMVKLNKRLGVDGVGIMNWHGTVGVDSQAGTDCARDALDAFPDYYWGLGTFDVMHETAETMRAQMESLYADHRFLGLKPYPQYGIRYDDPRYDAWWRFGDERGLYCGLHPTLWWEEAEFDGICPKWPNMTVVGYHVGGDYVFADHAINLAKKYPNFMCEPTLTPSCCGVIDYIAQGAGVDRLMYGSDQPMRDPRPQLGWVVYSRLSLDDKKQVLGGNAKRLLDGIRARQR